MDINELTERVIGCAYQVHNELGPGFLEKVYESALRLELEDAGLSVEQQSPVPVHYRGQVVGDFYADLIVQGQVIVELKAVQNLAIDLCRSNGKPQRSPRAQRKTRVTNNINIRFLCVLCVLCGKSFLLLCKVQ